LKEEFEQRLLREAVAVDPQLRSHASASVHDGFAAAQAACRRLSSATSSCEYFALQVGLSYAELPQYRLDGCVKDIENMSEFFWSSTSFILCACGVLRSEYLDQRDPKARRFSG